MEPSGILYICVLISLYIYLFKSCLSVCLRLHQPRTLCFFKEGLGEICDRKKYTISFSSPFRCPLNRLRIDPGLVCLVCINIILNMRKKSRAKASIFLKGAKTNSSFAPTSLQCIYFVVFNSPCKLYPIM